MDNAGSNNGDKGRVDNDVVGVDEDDEDEDDYYLQHALPYKQDNDEDDSLWVWIRLVKVA